MPNRTEIQNRIQNLKSGAQDVVRNDFLTQLYSHTGRNIINYATAYACGTDPKPSHAISIATDDIQGFMSAINDLKGDNLDLILHSPG
ncbi:MAG: hypothetical protein KAS17_11060 [Victivallaceae bacterium]|nr:hypothetical protein [Victivallaceae bacterium]